MLRQFGSVVMVGMAAVGCARSVPEIHELKGNISFNGEPVSYGTIEFIPDAAKGHEGPARSAEINNGAYDISIGGGKGLVKGAHIARVTIFSDKLSSLNPDETVVTKAPTPLCIGFPVEVNVEGPELNIEVPSSAKGFDMYKAGRPTGPRPGDP